MGSSKERAVDCEVVSQGSPNQASIESCEVSSEVHLSLDAVKSIIDEDNLEQI